MIYHVIFLLHYVYSWNTCPRAFFYLLGDKRTIIWFVVLSEQKLQSLSGYYLDEY